MTHPTIDLASDTSTRPTAAMRKAMAKAKVGDEQKDEDPSTTELCERAAALLGHQAALFLPSGTMANLIATNVHCRPGDEVIAARNAHIVNSEGAGISAVAGVGIITIDSSTGIFTEHDLAAIKRPLRHRSPRQKMISIEQTTNRGGGKVWPLETIKSLRQYADNNNLVLHMDGARLLNATIASGISAAQFGACCDSVWLDLSKGLGAPVGSVLTGSQEFINQAWTWKHRLGGAMRQSGIIASAGLHALEHHVGRIADDHLNAQYFAQEVANIKGFNLAFDEIETNLVFIDTRQHTITAPDLAQQLAQQGIRIGVEGNHMLRAVTHLDVDRAAIETALSALKNIAMSNSLSVAQM